MKRALLALGCVATLLATSVRTGHADPYDPKKLVAKKRKYPENKKSTNRGRQIYQKYCVGCHGDEGKGDGGGAPYLDPRPRDFSKGLFKFRSTKSGELPTDEDLFRSVARGVPSTSMPAWGEGIFRLDETEIWAVVYYVKTIGGGDFGDPDFDPYQGILPVPGPPAVSDARIERGRELFLNENKGACVKCHGKSGRGNGAEAGKQKDEWGDAILPTDMTKAWRYKNGTTVQDIYRTFSTGLTGTPMPGYGETFTDDERWDLAFFVRSLIEPGAPSGKRVLVAAKRDVIPGDPRDSAWHQVPRLDVFLAGQLVRAPRHPNIVVDMVTVRAMYNAEEIAFHITYNDRTESLKHQPVQAPRDIDDTYIPSKVLWQRRGQALRDSLQLQFPSGQRASGSLPYFYLGGASGPVVLWRWLANVKNSTFEERVQKGASRAPTTRPHNQTALSGRAHYKDGQWMVVMRRQRQRTESDDVAFREGAFVPFALQAWDGGNGEDGPLCAISSWNWVHLDRGTPVGAYLGALMGFVAAQLLVLLAVIYSRRRAKTIKQESPPATLEADA